MSALMQTQGENIEKKCDIDLSLGDTNNWAKKQIELHTEIE